MARNNSKNNQRFIGYSELFDEFLDYEVYRTNETLQKLYENLNFMDVTDTYTLSMMQEEALKLLNNLKESDIEVLLDRYRFNKKYLINSVKEEFRRKEGELSKIEQSIEDEYDLDDSLEENYEDDSEYTYDRTSSNLQNRTKVKRKGLSKISILPKKEKQNFCNYDQFMDALTNVKDRSKELGDLFDYLDLSSIDEIVRKNRINSVAKIYRRSVEKAFSFLKKSDVDAINNYLEFIYGKGISYKQKYILNEFTNRLKERFNSLSSRQSFGTFDNPYSDDDHYSFEEESQDTWANTHGSQNLSSAPSSSMRKFKSTKPIISNKESSKFRTVQKNLGTAGYTTDVSTFDPNFDKTSKFVSSSTSKEYKSAPVGMFKTPNVEMTGEQLRSFFKSDGTSVIDYIDREFGTNIAKNFFEQFKDIKTDDIRKYVDRTNQLIEDTMFYSYFPDVKKIVESVKSYFHLEFSPIKEDKDILEELITDELRYYQQKNIEKHLQSMDTTFLGSAKRLSRDDFAIDEIGAKMVFDELHTTYLPHYALTKSAFDKPVIIRTNRKELPEEYITKQLTGGSFLSNPTDVEVSKGQKGEYLVTASMSSRYKL